MINSIFKLNSKEIEKLCSAGGAAPSGGNTQPWLVEVNENALFIKLNPKRSESFLDVGHYASFFGIGCFLENLLIEAESLGLNFELTINAFTSFDKPLIKINFLNRDKSSNKFSLQPYIQKRITNRHISDGTTIKENIITNLSDIFLSLEDNQKFGLKTISSYQGKKKIADVLGKADAIRMLNGNAFDEMIHEFRWSDEDVYKSKDGLDLKTLELPKNAGKLYKLLKDNPFMRQVLPEKALADLARPLIMGCSHICCLYLSQPLSSKSMIIAGMLFERLWLTTSKLDIALQPWSVTTFFLIRKNLFNGKGFSQSEINTLNEIEDQLSKLFLYSKQNIPVMIFRLSITDKVPSAHSLRISWQEFTRIIE